MKLPLLLVLIACTIAICTAAVNLHSISRHAANLRSTPSTDTELLKKITAVTDTFHGDVAVYVHHIGRNTQVAINSNTIFPTASIVKIPLLIGTYDQLRQKKLELHQEFTYSVSQKYPGSGIMQNFADGSVVDLKTIMFLMISFSDNVASLWAQKLAGGGITINPILSSLGFNSTRVNSQTPGREEDWKQYGWGQTTAKEICDLVTLIRSRQVFPDRPDLNDAMYRMLGNHYYDENALSPIPVTVKTASKSGSLDDSRSEVVFVNAPRGDYVFSILTTHNQDQSWDDNNEAQVMIRTLSNIIYKHFNE